MVVTNMQTMEVHIFAYCDGQQIHQTLMNLWHKYKYIYFKNEMKKCMDKIIIKDIKKYMILKFDQNNLNNSKVTLYILACHKTA